jgi:hypothetical protein
MALAVALPSGTLMQCSVSHSCSCRDGVGQRLALHLSDLRGLVFELSINAVELPDQFDGRGRDAALGAYQWPEYLDAAAFWQKQDD